MFHPIQVVARLTGLSPHVIRVWEKRYGAVVPSRTGTNRRLYSDLEIARLRLLAQATGAGHKIGIIARLETPALALLVERLAAGDPTAPRPASAFPRRAPDGDAPLTRASRATALHDGEEHLRGSPTVEPDFGARLVRDGLAAIQRFDAAGLLRALESGSVQFGSNGVLQQVVSPLSHAIGDRWQKGEMAASHEHFASLQLREFLTNHARPFAAEEDAPRAVVATPAGQLHELGALMVSAVVAQLGWRPLYLGAALPAAELAGAVLQNGARAICLSVVYPADDPRLPSELRELRRLLPRTVEIMVGGRASSGYDGVLKEIGALTLGNLDALAERLKQIRASG